jgi:hypothetical protein
MHRVSPVKLVAALSFVMAAARAAQPVNPPASDSRPDFEADVYTGVVLDNFAAPELNALAYPQGLAGVKRSYVAGVDFEYRLAGNAGRLLPQLWVYGATVHAQRSADVNCSAAPVPGVCSLEAGVPPASPGTAFLSVLRNATSLEAYDGIRLELIPLQPRSADAAKLYVKSELGFMAVTGLGHLIDTNQRIALGAIATSGRFQGSYLEAGYGKNDLFVTHRGRRIKMEAYLRWDLSQWTKTHGVSPFIRMTVDSDFGAGSDSVRTSYGFDFDLAKILSPGGN